MYWTYHDIPNMNHDIFPMYWASPDVLMISPTSIMMSRRCTEYSPMYWTSPNVLMISPTCIMIFPRCTHDIPPMYSWFPSPMYSWFPPRCIHGSPPPPMYSWFPPMYSWFPPMYSWFPPNVFMVPPRCIYGSPRCIHGSPRCIHGSPRCIHGSPPIYSCISMYIFFEEKISLATSEMWEWNSVLKTPMIRIQVFHRWKSLKRLVSV